MRDFLVDYDQPEQLYVTRISLRIWMLVGCSTQWLEHSRPSSFYGMRLWSFTVAEDFANHRR